MACVTWCSLRPKHGLLIPYLLIRSISATRGGVLINLWNPTLGEQLKPHLGVPVVAITLSSQLDSGVSLHLRLRDVRLILVYRCKLWQVLAWVMSSRHGSTRPL